MIELKDPGKDTNIWTDWSKWWKGHTAAVYPVAG